MTSYKEGIHLGLFVCVVVVSMFYVLCYVMYYRVIHYMFVVIHYIADASIYQCYIKFVEVRWTLS